MKRCGAAIFSFLELLRLSQSVVIRAIRGKTFPEFPGRQEKDHHSRKQLVSLSVVIRTIRGN